MIFNHYQRSDNALFVSYRGQHVDGACVAMALGFDTASCHPNTPQVRLLMHGVAHMQKPATVLEAYARADRVGRRADNQTLSERRLGNLQYLLQIIGVPTDKIYNHFFQALGERFEAAIGTHDGTASDGARSVWLFVWPSMAAFKEGPTNAGRVDLKRLTDFGRRQAQQGQRR